MQIKRKENRTMVKSVAIITARGGSRRIPKKNIRNFCGKPIIAYSIEAALESGCFHEIMVSTDSEEIAEVARQYGASVPFLRSNETSNDFATTADVIQEVISEYERIGREFGTFCCIYPTAPFVTAEKIKDAYEQFDSYRADSLLAIVPYSFPPQRAFVIRDGSVAYLYPEHERTRSQDLEKIYHDCGQFYICSVEAFQKHHTLVMPHSVPYFLSEDEVQDIDTESDWCLAEMKYIIKHYKERNEKEMIDFILSSGI